MQGAPDVNEVEVSPEGQWRLNAKQPWQSILDPLTQQGPQVSSSQTFSAQPPSNIMGVAACAWHASHAGSAKVLPAIFRTMDQRRFTRVRCAGGVYHNLHALSLPGVHARRAAQAGGRTAAGLQSQRQSHDLTEDAEESESFGAELRKAAHAYASVSSPAAGTKRKAEVIDLADSDDDDQPPPPPVPRGPRSSHQSHQSQSGVSSAAPPPSHPGSSHAQVTPSAGCSADLCLVAEGPTQPDPAGRGPREGHALQPCVGMHLRVKHGLVVRRQVLVVKAARGCAEHPAAGDTRAPACQPGPSQPPHASILVQHKHRLPACALKGATRLLWQLPARGSDPERPPSSA